MYQNDSQQSSKQVQLNDVAILLCPILQINILVPFSPVLFSTVLFRIFLQI